MFSFLICAIFINCYILLLNDISNSKRYTDFLFLPMLGSVIREQTCFSPSPLKEFSKRLAIDHVLLGSLRHRRHFCLPTWWVKVYKFFSQWIFGGFILKTPLVIVLLPEEEEVYERKHIVSWNNTLGTILTVWFLKTTMPKGDSKGKGGRGKRGQQPRKKGDYATLCFVLGIFLLYWFITYFQLKLWIGS